MPNRLAVVCNICEMLQSKEAAYIFEKLTHDLCAVICQEEGRNPVSYDPTFLGKRRFVRHARFGDWHCFCELKIPISHDHHERVAVFVVAN